MILKFVRWVRGVCPECGAKLECSEGLYEMVRLVWCPKCPYSDEREVF